MKYVDEFRRSDLAQTLARRIAQRVLPDRQYRIMEFCGGHTHAIARHGIVALLPGAIKLIHGPGCPVCVLPMGRIDSAIDLSSEHPVTLCTYGDVLRVPGSASKSLEHARGAGCDVRMIYSCEQALDLARQDPKRQVVFFALGFETTTAPTALALLAARNEGLSNFSVYCNHVLTPPAMAHLLQDRSCRIDGILGPSHVSAVIGVAPYRHIGHDFHTPLVVTGFEPVDVLQAIEMLVEQINEGTSLVQNQFTRAVTEEGNLKAKAFIEQTMQVRQSFEWRGLGSVAHSALAIRSEFDKWDAEKKFAIRTTAKADLKVCECASILRGLKSPSDCKVFGKACTPATPLGACMVSSEGACAAYYAYGRFIDDAARHATPQSSGCTTEPIAS